MKVALLTDRLDGGTGGYAGRLWRGLEATGDEVFVWAVRPGSFPGVRRIRVPWTHGAGARWGAAALWRWQGIEADVVHALGRFPGAPIYRAGGGVHESWMAARGGGASWRDRIEARLDAATARAADVVVCNSAKVAGEMEGRLRIDAARLRVVRSGVDLARFTPSVALRARAREAWRVPERGRVLLFFGHGFARKGLEVAAAAFARVAAKADRFVVIGEDPDADAFRARVAGVLGERVVWMGAIGDAERWLPGADATILPTRYDAAANTTLEALACDVPAITSGQDGNGEIVPEGLCVRDPGDVVGFAAAIDAAWAGVYVGRCRAAAEVWPAVRNVMETKRVYQEWLDGEG
jgi:glycosyltransferase involved in cell wall biosynthesis